MKRFLLFVIFFSYFNFSLCRRTALVQETQEQGNEKITLCFETPIIPLDQIALGTELGGLDINSFDFSPTLISITHEINNDASSSSASESCSQSSSSSSSSETVDTASTSNDKNNGSIPDLFKADPDDFRQQTFPDSVGSIYVPVVPYINYYPVTLAAKNILSLYEISVDNFIKNSGSISQHHLHGELINLIEQAAILYDKALPTKAEKAVWNINSYVISTIDIAREYNCVGMKAQALTLVGWCKKILSCTKAIIPGVWQGCVNAAKGIVGNSAHVILWIRMPHYMVAYTAVSIGIQLAPIGLEIGEAVYKSYRNDEKLLLESMPTVHKAYEAIIDYLERSSIEEVVEITAATATQILLERKLFSLMSRMYQKGLRQGLKFVEERKLAGADISVSVNGTYSKSIAGQRNSLGGKGNKQSSKNKLKSSSTTSAVVNLTGQIPINIKEFGERKGFFMYRGTKVAAYESSMPNQWWSKDLSRHGGSCYKVFKGEGKKLTWEYDADELGKEIIGKNKGSVGLVVYLL